jgi:hypothetical protein
MTQKMNNPLSRSNGSVIQPKPWKDQIKSNYNPNDRGGCLRDFITMDITQVYRYFAEIESKATAKRMRQDKDYERIKRNYN